MSAPVSVNLSIVVPVFNEEEVIPELLTRLAAVQQRLSDLTIEIIFVNDGSRDNTAALLAAVASSEPNYQLIEFSRNFGHQAALSAGINAAGGEAVVTMDADLQDPPELIPDLVAAWRAGAEVVLAVRKSRAERGLRRLGFDLFHRCFNRLIDFPVEANTGTFGLLDRVAVDALKALPERHRFFPGLRAWVGFRTTEVFYHRLERAAGTPGQTFSRLVRYALDGLFSFSYLPLRLLTYTGCLIGFSGFSLGVFFVIRRLIGIEIAETGFTTLVTLALFLGGAQLVGIGILGEYLGRIYDEVKQRPHYIIKRSARSVG